MNDSAELTRRTLLKLAAGVTVAGGAAALGVRRASEPAVATSGLTAEDVSVAAPEGEVRALTLAPTVTVRWEHFPPIKTVAVRFRADGPQSNGTALDWTEKQRDSPASSGEMKFDVGKTPLLGKNGGPLDASSFHAKSEGRTTEKQVTVRMDVRLVDDNDDVVRELTPAAETTYAVRVTNRKSEVTVSGRLNTGAQCVRFNDFPESLWRDVECELREVT